MRVLSIDFDYFPRPTRQALKYYPDGIDLPTGLSNIIWATKYQYYNNIIRSVNIDRTELNILRQLLSAQPVSAPVRIANSHIEIYDFIYKHSVGSKVDLVNIDFHHDIFNNNKNLDCGNWIGHLEKENKLKTLSWVTTQTSLDAYGFTNDEIKTKHAKVYLSINEILNNKFDLIFLCRSDPWSPPHLDIYFDELKSFCQKRFKNIETETVVEHPREIEPILKNLVECTGKLQSVVDKKTAS